METFNYTTYCENCREINRITIPTEFRFKPVNYLESTEVKCSKCGERILI